MQDKGISEIKRDIIYLGDAKTFENTSKLKSYGIKSILSLSDFLIPPPEIEGINHNVVVCQDDNQQNLAQFFRECNEFIDNAERPIFIHCNCGVSRSPTILIAYLCGKNDYHLDKLIWLYLINENI